MGFAEYADHDAMGLAALVKSGQVSPAEVVEAAIERIERHNGVLNAVVYKAYDEARRTAASALPDGPFQGVPMLIKDLGMQVKGWPRTSASHFAQVATDAADSVLTGRYRAAGAILLGKTNTPEFGIPGVTQSDRLGPCGTPWNPEHIAGGSSGGSASAVAAGMVPMAQGGDGLGSIRIPAANCGLYGMKVTRNRTPLSEIADEPYGLVVEHVLTRTVRDSAAMLDATDAPQVAPYAHPAKAGPYLDEVSKSPGKLRIAWSAETPSGRPMSDQVVARLHDTVTLLKDLGHEVFEMGLGIDYRAFYKAQGLASAANFAANVKRWVERLGREPNEGELGPLAARGYAAGQRVTGQQAFGGLQQLRYFSQQILDRFQQFDVYLTPTMSTPPPRIDWLDPLTGELRDFDKRQASTYGTTPPFNITGQPSVSIPLWMSEDGLPIGMMFTGRYADEATLFRLSGQLEKEQPWKDRRPKVWG